MSALSSRRSCHPHRDAQKLKWLILGHATFPRCSSSAPTSSATYRQPFLRSPSIKTRETYHVVYLYSNHIEVPTISADYGTQPFAQERPFAVYQLHVPLLYGEKVTYRRFSDFVALDTNLRNSETWVDAALRIACCGVSDLPPLPAKTGFWQDSTSPAIISRRWGALQLYLDAALESLQRKQLSDHAWKMMKDFLDA